MKKNSFKGFSEAKHFVFMLLLLGSASCSDTSDSGKEIAYSEKVIGKWKVTEAYVAEKKIDFSVSMIFDFLPSGSVVISDEIEMTYKVDHDHVEIRKESGSYFLSGNISFNGSQMLLEGTNDNDETVRMYFDPTLGDEIDDGMPGFLQSSGWVHFSEVCEISKEYGLSDFQNADCSEGTGVTDASSFMNAIYWAGEVVEMYHDKSSGEFTNFRVEVTWVSPRSPYECGQIVRKKPSEVKEFTHTSLSLRKCN